MRVQPAQSLSTSPSPLLASPTDCDCAVNAPKSINGQTLGSPTRGPRAFLYPAEVAEYGFPDMTPARLNSLFGLITLLATGGLLFAPANALAYQNQPVPPAGVAPVEPTAETPDTEAPGSETPDAEAPEGSRFERKTRDDVDAAGPFDDIATRRLQQIEQYIQDERWDRALEMLRYTLDQNAGGLVRLRDGRLVPVVEQVHEFFTELPEESVDFWRREYDAVAEKHFQTATETGRLDLLEQVATQFRPTAAGRRAAIRLARIHADRGELALAARYLQSLEPNEVPAATRLRAARVWLALHKDDIAQTWLDALSENDLTTLLPAWQEPAQGDRVAAMRERFPIPTDPSAASGQKTASQPDSTVIPLLLERWHRPLTQDVARQVDLQRLNDDVQNRIHAIVAAASPLAVGNLVVARMLDRVVAFDINNGTLAWESAAEDFGGSGEAASRNRPGVLGPGRRFPGAWQRDQTDPTANPESTTLFLDVANGSLTSDEENIYFIETARSDSQENPPSLRFGRFDQVSSGPVSNVLQAYDAKTGRFAWPEFAGVGGDLDLGPFERPLSGYFFFGPPLSRPDELYAIAERDLQIDLVALDPKSGLKRWSRTIASAPQAIDQEPVRQQWHAQVAEANGILVCPTTVGWLVAVNRQNHELLWAFRYSPPGTTDPRASQNERVPQAGLDQRWGHSRPVIIDGRVIFTPPEEPRLVCLDLMTGELLWRKGKGAYRYIAGTADGSLIVVGPRAVDGIDPATGVVRWSCRIPESDGYVTGRGILMPHELLLPLQHAVLSISTTDGTVQNRVATPAGTPALGNLVAHQGAIVSLGPSGLSVYEERNHFLEAIQQTQAEQSADQQAAFMRARLSLAEGRPEEAVSALNSLRLASDKKYPSPVQVRDLLWTALVQLIQAEPSKQIDHLTELEALADSPDRRSTLLRLRAASLAANGQTAEAARHFLQLLEEPAHATVTADGPGQRAIYLDAWLAGQILDLWNQADPANRQALEQQLRDHLNAPPSQETAPTSPRLRQIVATLPFMRQDNLEDTRRQLQRAPTGASGQTEIQLLRLLADQDKSYQPAIVEELAKLAEQHHLLDDAAFWRGTVNAAAPSEPKTLASPAASPAWTNLELSVVGARINSTGNNSEPIQPLDAYLPFFQNNAVSVYDNLERLVYALPTPTAGTSGAPSESHSIPLRARRGRSRSTGHAVGHLLVMEYHDVVQAVSLLDGQVLWSWLAQEPLESRRDNAQLEPMQTGHGFIARENLLRRSQAEAPILVANAQYVLVKDRQRLTALDTLTGEIRWTRNPWGPEATYLGTQDYLFVMPNPRDRAEIEVIRALDGQPADLPEAIPHIPRTFGAIGNHFLTLNWADSINVLSVRVGGGLLLSLVDPVTNQPVWSHQFDRDALIRRDRDGTLFILSPTEGELVAINPITGQLTELGVLPPEILNHRSEVFLFTDSERVYTLVNRGRPELSYLSSELSAIAVNGVLYAIDPHGGGILWHSEVPQQRLIFESLAQMPFLLFAKGGQERIAEQTAWHVTVMALDKLTGKTLIDEQRFVRTSPMFRDFILDPRRQIIELAFYSERLRLSARPAENLLPVEAPR